MAMPSEAEKPYLAVCGIYRWEADYLREWVAFHRLVGVERFFLYDNDSEDEHLEALQPFIDDGSVVVREWPHHPGQKLAYNDFIERHRDDARWVAFIDCDEFLFSPTGKPLPEVLRRYEKWPAVGVNRRWMGTSFHERKPEGLVLENFTYWLDLPEPNKAIKTIADPQRAESCMNAHCFTYRDGALAVDENETPFEGWVAESYDQEILRLNHYFTKSEEEAALKFSRPHAGYGPPREPLNLKAVRRRNRTYGVVDDSIQRWLPELKDAMARLERGEPFEPRTAGARVE
jgi:hypothetical protein